MADQADTPQVPQREPRFADAAAFGRFLQAHRQERNISLQQVANDTKIPDRHLAALERGDIAQWPGGIYRRAMIRAYATAVRLNPNEMADEFAALFSDHTERSIEALPNVKQTEHERPSGGPTMGVLASVICAAVAAAFAWYGLSIATEMTPSAPAVAVKPIAQPETEKPIAQPEAVIAHSEAEKPIAQPEAAIAHSESAKRIAQPETVATSGTTTLTSVSSQPLPSTPSVQVVEPQATPTPLSSVNPEIALEVTSEPAGAQVTVNGIRWGETPLTIRHLPPGEKQLRLTKEGYLSVERQLHLTNDNSLQTLSVDLEVQP